MDEKIVIPADELAAEQAALADKKEEEIRASVISEFGFDEAADAERIEKAVTKELDHSKKLSKAIGQKIEWRTKATTPKEPAPTAQEHKPEDIAKTVEATVAKTLEQRDLDSMDYPDNIKSEIKRIAQMTGKSVSQAAKDPYVVSTYIEPYEKEQKTNEAAITRTNRSSGEKKFSLDNPPEVDMSTEDGRKTWDSWLETMRKEGN